MATELRERFPDHVEITLFTPPEETRTGADWYWRFEKGGGAIHARVQAKRVQRTEFGQTDDRGHVDLDMPQLTQLVEATRSVPDALAGLQAWLATYARFEANPPCGSNDLQRRHHHRHQAECVANHGPSVSHSRPDVRAGARPGSGVGTRDRGSRGGVPRGWLSSRCS